MISTFPEHFVALPFFLQLNLCAMIKRLAQKVFVSVQISKFWQYGVIKEFSAREKCGKNKEIFAILKSSLIFKNILTLRAYMGGSQFDLRNVFDTGNHVVGEITFKNPKQVFLSDSTLKIPNILA